MTLPLDQAKLAEAVQHMRQATWPPDKWAKAIRDGYPPGKDGAPGKPYNYPNTANYRAQQALWEAAHPKVGTQNPEKPNEPNPPPPTTVDPRSQYVVFCAQEPANALRAPAKYAIAFSADRAYRDEALPVVIGSARRQGHRVAGWCDCRPNGGTPASAGVQFVKDYGLDYFIGQAESAAEFDNAMSVGAPVVVGNITALRQDQLDRIARGEVAFQQEDYWNEGWARAQSPLISAYIAGIYPTALWNPTIAQYKQAGRWRDGDGLYHAAAVADWQNLP